MDTRRNLIVIIIVALLCFTIGIGVGTYSTIKVGVAIASGFIDVDYELISNAIHRYRTQVETEFPRKNETLQICTT